VGIQKRIIKIREVLGDGGLINCRVKNEIKVSINELNAWIAIEIIQ
jgi:hypothetical protein